MYEEIVNMLIKLTKKGKLLWSINERNHRKVDMTSWFQIGGVNSFVSLRGLEDNLVLTLHKIWKPNI